MIDRAARDRLAELVRHFVAGRIRAGAFDAEAEAIAEESNDPGVHWVYGRTWRLYGWRIYRGGDFLIGHYLRGQYRVSDAERRQMAIAILFLYSDAEFEWPDNYPANWRDQWLGLACFGCGLTGSVLALIMTPLLATAHLPGLALLALAIGVVCWIAVVRLYLYSKEYVDHLHARWEAEMRCLGDYDVWPFRRVVDFDEARRHPRLLRGV
jgi:hypothetical protein